jgi:hypothetical protein
MTPEEQTYYSNNLLSKKVREDLMAWKWRCEQELGSLEINRKIMYSALTDSMVCRGCFALLTDEQLQEKYWRCCEISIPYYKTEIENATVLLQRHNEAVFKLRNSMQPFTGINLKQQKLIQSKLF